MRCVTEDSKIVFEVEVEDEEAEVTWLHDNIEFKPERSRYGYFFFKSLLTY